GHPMLLLDAAGLAEVAGLRFSRIDRVEEDAPVDAQDDAGIEALLFEDIDGRRRAIPLAAISRIEPLPVTAVHHAAGHYWLSCGGA
ncbi:UNVERIFIED_CONTAM: chemotaxis protein CheA, partial [Bacteroidetes bacterium 56_B9]